MNASNHIHSPAQGDTTVRKDGNGRVRAAAFETLQRVQASWCV